MKTAIVLLVCTVFLFSCHQNKSNPTVRNTHYTLSGKGKTTIVFVHGWCINRSYWEAQERYFSPTYQVLTIDLAGHGENNTERRDWRIEKYAEDIVQVIESLCLEHVILIGHSMAGDINLHVYEKIPQRVIGFVGIDNFQEMGKEYNETERKQTAEALGMMQKDFVSVVTQFAEGNLFSPQTDSVVRKRVIHDITTANPQMAVATLESLSQQNVQEQRIAPMLKIPLMLVNSDRSSVDEGLLKKYCGSGYRIRTVHGTGHYPMIEVPDEFNARLAETLQEIEGR